MSNAAPAQTAAVLPHPKLRTDGGRLLRLPGLTRETARLIRRDLHMGTLPETQPELDVSNVE